MYDRVLNQSRTSLTTNSSRTARIVRKRGSDLSNGFNRSKSKNKQDDCNTSFEQYLTRQTKIFEIENAETIQYEKGNKNFKNEKTDRVQRSGALNTHLTLSQTLSAIQINKASIIERSDRYIQHRSSLDTDLQSETNNARENKKDNRSIQRKRQPTPVKSKKQIASGDKTKENQNYSNLIFQLQLRVTGLQDLLTKETKQKQKIKLELQSVFRDRQSLRQVVSQMEMENKILLGEKKNCEEKIDNLQKAVIESQNNLTVAQNNLNKLRQTIKQNRLNELQSQIRKLSKLNQNLQQMNRKLEQDNAYTMEKLKSVSKQLQDLRKIGDLQTLAKKQSMKEEYLMREVERMKQENELYRRSSQNQKQKYLEERFMKQEEEIFRMKQEMNLLMIKVHCLQNLKEKELNEIRQKSESEVKSLRVRYSKMISDLRSKNKNISSDSNLKGSTCTPKTGELAKGQKSPDKNNIANSYNIQSKCLIGGSSSSNIGATIKNNAISSIINGGMGEKSIGNNDRNSKPDKNRGWNEQLRNGRGDENFALQLSPE